MIVKDTLRLKVLKADLERQPPIGDRSSRELGAALSSHHLAIICVL
jgi:hypothetical protein